MTYVRLYLVVGGIACVVLGWLWDYQFPVIKNLWTSSFVLVAVGYSSVLLGLFYLVVDVWKFRSWAQAVCLDRHEPDHDLHDP